MALYKRKEVDLLNPAPKSYKDKGALPVLEARDSTRLEPRVSGLPAKKLASPATIITNESLIKSYQNGLSKGYSAGLEISLEFVKDLKQHELSIPELLRELEKFIRRSQSEQNKSS